LQAGREVGRLAERQLFLPGATPFASSYAGLSNGVPSSSRK
jgi:hypothetical protein